MKRIALLLSACLFLVEVAVGQSAPPTQVTPSNDTGIKAYETYSGAHENINLSNGNLSLNIPLVFLPGRNGLNLDLTLQYNSKIWVPHAIYGNGSDIIYHWWSEPSAVSDLGWTFNLPGINSGDYIVDAAGYLIGKTPYIIDLPSGGKASVQCCNRVMDSQDGSFVTLYRDGGTDFNASDKPLTLLLKDGTQVHFPCEMCGADRMSDANHNYITLGGPQITDTLGRPVTFTTAGSYPNRTETISYPGSNGNPQNVVLTMSAVTLFQTSGDPTTNQYYTGATPFQYPQPRGNCYNCTKHVWVYPPGNDTNFLLLTRIDMPGNMSYTFSYNGYGELIKITYPTGGYTRYTYAAYTHGETFWADAGLNISADFREVTSKRVCRNASGLCSPSEEDVTLYDASIAVLELNNHSIDVKHVLDEANNVFEKATYQFTDRGSDFTDSFGQYYSPRETKRSTYSSGGVLLRTTETAYATEPDLDGVDGGLPASVTTTLYDVNPPLVKRADTTYDTYSPTVLWFAWSDYVNQTPQTRTRMIDNPLTQTEYDYGPNAVGPVLRTTNTTWWKGRWPDHLWSRPLTQEIQDGSGARTAYTQFEYEHYTEPLASSGATQHTGSSMGNQTAVSAWRKSDGAMLTTRRQFDDTGNVVKVTDPGGHWTTFSFADSWNDATCAPTGGTAAAYPTLVTNQLGHKVQTKYNSCTGTVASQQDANQQTTTTTYDPLSRPLTVTYPDTGSTQYTYASPTHTTIKKKPSSSVTDPSLWPTTELYSDGLGRSSQTASKNGEAASGWDVKTTCYDTRGYPSFSSYTVQVSAVPIESPCSLAGDSLQIDALGRATQLTHSDGTTILTDYAGQATRVRDEGKDASGNRVTRVTQVDGLGRLTSVCEKTGVTQMGAAGAPNAPVACGQDIAETGFLTSYQYDIAEPAGTAMQVLQPGLANRYFVYDSLGNLLKATNPESGTTQYSYNDDGTLHTKVRPKPNQPDPNTVVTTTYAYDELHRLTQTDYDDNSTASVYRGYDQTGATTGQTLTQPVGRMTTLTTLGGRSVDLYSYDAMGRVIANWQCTPQQSCGTAMKQLAYNYDLLGNVTSASNGFGVNIGYGYNVAERLQTVTSSLSDSTHPGTLMSNASYGPFGLTSAAFGNGVQEVRGYTSRAILNSISDNVTITQPAVPGSGSVTLSGAERTSGGPPATVATGSVTLSGSEQSTQVVDQPAVGGSGSLNLSGSEQNTQAVSNPGAPAQGSITVSGYALRGYDDSGCLCHIYDSGTVTVTVGGDGGPSATANYHQGTDASNLAAQLAGNLRVGVTATSSGGVVTITWATNGANSNGAVVSVTQSSDRPDVFPNGSFTLSTANLSGGVDPIYYTLYDSGTVTATVNGFSKSTSYGQGSTPSAVAMGLASAFNGDGSSPVNATASGTSLTLTSKATGASTNYSLSSSSGTSYPGYFSQPSFLAHAPIASLLGGRDTTYRTLYDSGTIGITVNGVTKSAPYDQNSTPAGLASSLAASFSNDPGAPVTATASGATVSMTTRATGVSANYSLSSVGSTSQSTYFSHASYAGSASGINLTGGQNTGAPVNDTGTATITVNGFAKSASYGQASTASSLASALASVFNADNSSPVTASVSGGTITVTAKSGGVATNYALSVSSASNQSGFTGTSFPVSTSAATLTGGTDSSQIPTTPYSVNLTFMPNGNVATANDNVNGNWSYGYDDFNRLSSSSKTGAAYTYDYDRYGNRWHQNGPTTNLLSFSNANNRIDGFVYDAAGNVLNDGQGHTFTYDAENRVIAMGSDVAYAYDGDGRRIRKTVNGVSADVLYDLEDHVIAEMNSSGGWNRGEIFAGGRHLATYAWSTTFFTHADWQGTERARTALSGVVSETCSSLPFGDALSCSGMETSPDHFTGKEHDAESGLDYFGARYYGSDLGRFMSPDWSETPEPVPYARFNDPQSLNLYSYTRNDPISYIDLDGHKCASQANGDVHCDVPDKKPPPPVDPQSLLFQAVFHSPQARQTWNLSSRTMDNYIARPLLTALTFAVPGVLEADAVEAVTLGFMEEEAVIPDSIPAGPSARPSAAQQRQINEMGNAHGCHTCGAETPGTKSGNWVGDHQPSTAVNPPGNPQVYRPQCLLCSRRQGGILRAAQAKAAAAAARAKARARQDAQ